jgi:hypothetical protein
MSTLTKYPYQKVYRDEKVAVIYSPGYGAGWSTWNTEYKYSEALIFDKDLVEPILAKDYPKLMQVVSAKYPDVYTGGLDQAEIAWVDIGNQFDISEYDGSESVRIIGPSSFYTT